MSNKGLSYNIHYHHYYHHYYNNYHHHYHYHHYHHHHHNHHYYLPLSTDRAIPFAPKQLSYLAMHKGPERLLLLQQRW